MASFRELLYFSEYFTKSKDPHPELRTSPEVGFPSTPADQLARDHRSAVRHENLR